MKMDKATLSIELSTLVFGSFCFVLGNLAMTLFSSSKNSNDGDSKMKPSNQATSVSNTELSTELLARVTELQKEASENRLLFTVLLTKLADMERRENESFATLASKMVNSEDLIMDVKREVVILKKSSQIISRRNSIRTETEPGSLNNSRVRRASLTLETNIEGADENMYLNEKDKPLNLANLKLQNDSTATVKAALAALSAKALTLEGLRVPGSPNGKLFGSVGPESRESTELTPRW